MINTKINVSLNKPEEKKDFYNNAIKALYETEEIRLSGTGRIGISLHEREVIGRENEYCIEIDASRAYIDVSRTNKFDNRFTGEISLLGKSREEFSGKFTIRNIETREEFHYVVRF